RKPPDRAGFAPEPRRAAVRQGELCYARRKAAGDTTARPHQRGEGLLARNARGRTAGMSATRIPRRRFLHLAAGAAALSGSRSVHAETWPSRPVRWVVGFPPGGGADIVSRIMAAWLGERLGQQVYVENRPGASTNISIQNVIASPPDGYTLLFVAASAAV